MAETVNALYNCTMAALYSICRTAWQNCTDNLADFTAYKSKYIAAFITAAETAIDNAEALPDEEIRNSASEVSRIELQGLLVPCLDNYVKLEGYIIDAFPKAQHQTRFEAAGKPKYAPASNENWEEGKALNTSMKQFITANLAALTAGGNMPVAFQTKVTNDGTAYNNKYNQFKISRETGVATAAKVTANNGIYEALTDMLDDGQRIYRNNAEKKKLFEFTTIKNLVAPPGSASLNVTVLQTGTNMPVVNKTVTIQSEEGTPKTFNTDESGEVTFTSIDPDRYDGTVKDGATVLSSFTKDVDTGVQARKTVFIN